MGFGLPLPICVGFVCGGIVVVMSASPSVDGFGDLSVLGPVERARAVAIVAHAGQVDKAGAPYVSHSFRVMDRLASLDGFVSLSADDQQMALVAAGLHDVVEDSPLSLADVAALFPELPRVSMVVDALTKRRGESNVDYYSRVAASHVAVVVKHADLLDNCDPVRRAALDAETFDRTGRKYAVAFRALGFDVPEHLVDFA